MRTAPPAPPGSALVSVRRSRDPRTASKVITVGLSEAVAQSVRAPLTGAYACPSHTSTAAPAGRAWVASSVKETATRSRVRGRPKPTDTQSPARAPPNAGSSAAAGSTKALAPDARAVNNWSDNCNYIR